MKLGRLILTHRQELILPIKEYYLSGGRTDFLVIAYNQATVDAGQFLETENFKLFPYLGKGLNGSILGQQFLVWKNAAKKYPEIDFWIAHDYDVLVKPADHEISKLVGSGEYAVIGQPFPNWQKGMKSKESARDLFPFLRHYISEGDVKDKIFKTYEKVLIQNFPYSFEGVPTILSGNGDFIATSRENLLLLDDTKLEQFPVGGTEQIPHTVLRYYGIEAKDLRSYFSIRISLDNTTYVPFRNKFDFTHPVKFWPGVSDPGLILRLKKFIKEYWPKNRPATSIPKK